TPAVGSDSFLGPGKRGLHGSRNVALAANRSCRRVSFDPRADDLGIAPAADSPPTGVDRLARRKTARGPDARADARRARRLCAPAVGRFEPLFLLVSSFGLGSPASSL